MTGDDGRVRRASPHGHAGAGAVRQRNRSVLGRAETAATPTRLIDRLTSTSTSELHQGGLKVRGRLKLGLGWSIPCSFEYAGGHEKAAGLLGQARMTFLEGTG